jgi:CheY-like chemotaxis protein
VEGAARRILVVDDYEPWRRFAYSMLQKQPEYQVIGEASDGLEAIHQTEELQPDIILLDIGLPTLNGIETAHRIREVSLASIILFVSENRSREVVAEALRTGASGYVVKSDAARELLPALKAVLEGKRFVSASLAGSQKKIRHEVEFYADDAGLVDGFARFIEAALEEGNPIIVVATDSHQASLLQRLIADGFNMPVEIEQGNYIPLEVRETLSSFMVNDSPDRVMFRKMAGDLITKAAKQARGDHRRVAVCGEGVHTLFATGNVEATITLERMWNEIGTQYELDILCAYFRSDFATEENISTLERVCTEHSAVYGRRRG